MKIETKRMALFGLIISGLTSTYVPFLGTGLKQGFFTNGFIGNWLPTIPKAYIVICGIFFSNRHTHKFISNS